MDNSKISKICEERKISIPELAEKIGFSRQGLNKAIFDSKSSMKVDTLVSIAKALDVSVMEFIDEEHYRKVRMDLLETRENYNQLRKEHNDLKLENDKNKAEVKLRNDELDFLTNRYNSLEELYKNQVILVKDYKYLIDQFKIKLSPESEQPEE